MNSTGYPEFEWPIRACVKHYPLLSYILTYNISTNMDSLYRIWRLLIKNKLPGIKYKE